jgi:hypothetical protein
MLHQFTAHVLLPALACDTQAGPPTLRNTRNTLSDLIFKMRTTDSVQQAITFSPTESDLRTFHEKADALFAQNKTSAEVVKVLRQDPSLHDTLQQIFRSRRLSDCWHHPAIGLPRDALPLEGGREWHALVDKPFIAKNGLIISCLTSSKELLEESTQLDHCVGRNAGYDLKCCSTDPRNRVHILSIHGLKADGSRRAISTLEVQVEKPVELGIDGKKDKIDMGLKVLQHYGKGNSDPSQEAQAAWDEFVVALREGKEKIKDYYDDELGETEASQEKFSKYSKLERTVGYRPTTDSVNGLFDRFRMSERAAIIGTDSQGKRIYDTSKSEDGYKHYEHFIDGYAVISKDGRPTGRIALRPSQLALGEGERTIPLRDLGIDNWINATGLREPLKTVVAEHCVKAPEWRQHSAIDTAPRPIPDESKPHNHVREVQVQQRLNGNALNR